MLENREEKQWKRRNINHKELYQKLKIIQQESIMMKQFFIERKINDPSRWDSIKMSSRWLLDETLNNFFALIRQDFSRKLN